MKRRNLIKTKVFLVTATMFYPLVSLAADDFKNPLWKDLVLTVFPMLIFFLVAWAAIKFGTKKTSSVNEKIVESNERIAKSLEELVEILRSKSN